jgi:hypothetical protein
MAPSGTQSASPIPRLIHLSLMVTPVAFAAVVWFVIRTRPMPPAGNPVVHFALVGVALMAMMAGALMALRIEPRKAGQSDASYWRATLPRAIMIWGLFEAGALLATIAGLLSAVMLYPLLGTMAFLGLMIGFTPGRLAGG